MWTFDEMKIRDLVPDLVSYNRAIGGCSDEGEWEMALSLVLEADRRGLTPDKESFTLAMNAVMKAKEAVRAHDLLNVMKQEHGIAPEREMLMMVADLCTEVGEVARAEEIARELGKRGLGQHQ